METNKTKAIAAAKRRMEQARSELRAIVARIEEVQRAGLWTVADLETFAACASNAGTILEYAARWSESAATGEYNFVEPKTPRAR